MNTDRVEYYNIDAEDEHRGLIGSFKSSIVPPPDSLISIQKRTWKVIQVTYTIDYADTVNQQMRANVDLRLLPKEPK